jgi:hypothetical protein
MEDINQIGQMASGLMLYEFDFVEEPTARLAELNTVSGSLSGKLGELNILLNQSFRFTGDDGNPYPRLQEEESDILEQLYIRDYNTKQAQKLLRGVYDSTTESSIVENTSDWIELQEGDTKIKRSPGSISNSASNRISMSKDFKALAKDAKDKIEDLVYNYNMYGAQPRQVAGLDAPIVSGQS